MNEKFYNGDKEVTQEEFEKERQLVITERIKEAENDDNLIDDEDLDYYLSELEKMEE